MKNSTRSVFSNNATSFVNKYARMACMAVLLCFISLTKSYAANLAVSTPTAVAASTICPSATNVPIYRFSLAATGGATTFTGLTFTQAGTATSSDIVQYKLWSGSVGGTLRATSTTPSFSGFSIAISIISITPGVYFITADIAASPTTGNTIIVSPLTASNITVGTGTTSTTGTILTGGIQTIGAGSPGAITGNAPICASGSTVALGDPTSGGTWSSGATAVATVGSAGLVTSGTTPGTATVTYSTGCGTAATAIVTVNALPTVTFTAQPGATACINTNVTYTTQTGMTNYLWGFTGTSGIDYNIISGGTIADNTVTLQWLTTGSRTVTVNYTDGNSCTASSATSSTATAVSGIPALTGLPASQTVCFNASTAQTAPFAYTGASNGANQYTLTWLPGGILTDVSSFTALPGSTSGTFNVNVPAGTAPNTYSGTLTIQNPSGCTSTSAMNIVVPGLPALTGLPASQNVCFNASSVQTASFAYTAVANGANQYTLTWLPGGVLTDVAAFTAIPGATSGTFSLGLPAGAPANTYTGTLTLKNSVTGCTSVSTITVAVNGLPSLTGLPASQSLCFNGSSAQTAPFAYTAATNGADQYTLTWSPGGPANVSSFTALPGGTINVNVPAGTAPGSYTGTLTVENSTTGCTTTSVITIAVNGLPALTGLTTSQNFCFNASFVQTALFAYTGVASGANQYTLTWSPGGVLTDVSSFTGLPGSPGGTISVSIPASAAVATYTGTLTIKNSVTGCTTASTYTIVVNGLPSLTGLPAKDSLCFNASAAQTAPFAYTGVANGANQYLLTWSPGGALADILAFTSLPGSSGTLNINVPVSTTGAYTGTLVVKNSATGCTNTSTITTVINNVPALTGLDVNQAFCFNSAAADTASFAYSGTSGGANTYTLTWLPGGALANVAIPASLPAGQIKVAVPASAPANTYTGILTVSNPNGCTTTYTITTVVNALPVLTGLTTNQALCFDTSAASTALFHYSGITGGADEYTLTWSPGSVLTDVSSFTALTGSPGGTLAVNVPAGTPAAIYTGTLTTKNSVTGCIGNTVITIVVNPLPAVTGLTTSQTFCENPYSTQTALFNYTGIINGADQYTLTWLPSGTLPFVSSYTALPDSISVNVPDNTYAGIYTGTLTIGNSITGCKTISSISIVVDSLPFAWGIDEPTDQNPIICYNGSSSQTVLITDSVNSQANQYTLTWSPADVLTDVNTFTAIRDSSKDTISVNVPVAAAVNSYTGTLILRNSLTGCIDTMPSITLRIFPLPPPISGDSNICVGVPATLNDAGLFGTWSSSNSSLATINSATGAVTGIIAGSMPNITYSIIEAVSPYLVCSSTMQVTVNPLPSAILGSANVCIGAATMFNNATLGGTWSSSDTTLATIADGSPGAGIVTGISTGTLTITYTSLAGCTVTKTITVYNNPSAITGTAGVCVGSTTALSDSTAGGTWSSSNASLASVDMSTGMVTGITAVGNPTITYTSGVGCIATIQVTLNPVPFAISGITNVCSGSVTTLTDLPVGGVWSSSDGTAAVISGGPGIGIVTGISGGSPAITYTLGPGCYAVTAVIVNPVAVIAGVTNVCFGTMIALSDIFSGGGTWNSSDMTTATVDPSGNVTGVAAGAAVISYTLPTGCLTATPVVFQVIPAAITGAADVCAGAVIALSNDTAGGSWSSSNTSLAIVSGAGIVSGVSAGTPTISYTISSGCSAIYAVNVNPLPVTPDPITGTTTLCASSAAVLTNTTPDGVWSSSNMSVASAEPTGNIIGLSAGTTTISYTVTNGCGSSVAMSAMTVNPMPLTPAAITGVTTVCNGSGVLLSDAVAGGAWTVDTASAAIATISTTGLVTGLAVGVATINYSNVNGCGTVSATAFVTVNPLPDAGSVSGGVPVLCAGSITPLSDPATGGAWSSGNVAAATVNSTGNVTGVATGLANISYTVTNSCGTVSAMMAVSVNSLPATPATITGITNVCPGSGSLLHDITPVGIWSSTNTTVATVNTAGMVTGLTAGTTNISYTKINGCGSAAAGTAFTVNPLPAADSITGVPTICVGSVSLLNDLPAGGIWLSENNSVAVVSPLGIVTAIAPGTTTISYVATNSCGSSSAATVTVTVSQVPMAGSITGTQNICPGKTTGLTETATGGAWSSSNTSIAAIGATGIVSGISTGVATITYKVTNSCGTVNAVFLVNVRSLNVCDESTQMDNVAGTELKAFPNPNNGTFTILLSSTVDEQVHIVITDAVGQKVSEMITATNKPLEVTGRQATGIYFVSAVTANGRYIAKVVVE